MALKKTKCDGFLFKIFEPKMSIRSTNVALAGNGSRLCEGKGLEALNFKLIKND